MAEYTDAYITIGGKLKRSKVAEFIKAIRSDALCTQNSYSLYEPTSEEDLLTHNHPLDEHGRLDLFDEEARWGRFDAVEAVCKKLKLWFQRANGRTWDVNEGIEWWKPGMKDPEWLDTLDGYEMLRRREVHKLLLKTKSIREARKLFAESPGIMNEIPPLEIVNG